MEKNTNARKDIYDCVDVTFLNSVNVIKIMLQSAQCSREDALGLCLLCNIACQNVVAVTLL